MFKRNPVKGKNDLNQGFSLVEILVVVVILGILIATGGSLLMNILGSTSKSRVFTEVRQNGQYAIGLMERQIRNARSLDGYDTLSGQWLVIENSDGETYTTFSCQDLDPGPDDDLALTREVSDNPGVEQRLTGASVEVVDCNNVFSVTEGVEGASPDEVRIRFDLSQSGTAVRAEETALIPFLKMISIRNY